MTNALSIPLFHFPSLVYERIIELMCMKAKFQMASLSEHAAIIVRRIMEKQSIKMVIRFEVHTATVFLSNDEFDMKLASWCYDLQTSAKLMVYEINNMKNVVQLSSFKMVFWQPLFNDFNFFHSWFMGNVILEPNYVEAVKSTPNDELCEVLFKKYKNAQQLVMHCETTPGFTITPEKWGNTRSRTS
ncbi:hypothetical protein CAEBREN_18415 [Caenorhabditis brenneri]|uniref:Uncharacterized protein n=1 Tax=Caenorhabditis brenneri TaxID=135651 RepID=G0M8K9_CAEBE|nr:hypothetical protein CAEBREN_18415 [Caenorhabditis brenneri]